MENIMKKQNTKKIILSKGLLTPTDVKEYMEVGVHRAYDIVKKIRYQNSEYYKNKKSVFGKTNILPLHLMEYLGWTRQEFFNYISDKNIIS